MNRPERWWRPAGQRRNTRPAVRSARRARYAAEQHYMDGFTLGMDVGEAKERRRSERRDDHITRLARAADAAANGDPSLLDELALEAAADDLLDVADAAGVLSDDEDKALWDSVPPHGSGMVVEIEQWLRDRDRWQEGDG